MTGSLKNKKNSIDSILGNSQAVHQVKSLIRQVAPSDITVLVSGESGTGKELAAKALHDLSRRKTGPLMTLNCGAIPEGIFESEIFGHEKGSFTSAEKLRKGYFELSDKGTLFLDEIGEMPLTVQVKILRVLETNKFLRVGGTNEVEVDVRIIAATNRDLGYEVEKGTFRRDLYYRLKAVSIELPNLRNGVDDIPLLANNFVKLFSIKNNRPIPEFESLALQLLQQNHWAGNVRELKNFVESLAALSPAQVFTSDFVRSRLGGSFASSNNLPVIMNRPQAEADKDLVYRTLLEMRHELNGIKGLLQELISRDRSLEFPFRRDEEVVTLSPQDIDNHKADNGNIFEQNDAESLQSQMSLEELEREQIRRTLFKFNGNRRLTAKTLNIGERTLYRKIKLYKLQ